MVLTTPRRESQRDRSRTQYRKARGLRVMIAGTTIVLGLNLAFWSTLVTGAALGPGYALNHGGSGSNSGSSLATSGQVGIAAGAAGAGILSYFALGPGGGGALLGARRK